MSSLSSVGGSQSANALAQVMQRLAQATGGSRGAGRGEQASAAWQAASSSGDGGGGGSTATSGPAQRPPPGHPPEVPPMAQAFSVQRSTASMGGQRGGDPVAGLDSDGDGGVSASEFGLPVAGAAGSDDTATAAATGSGDTQPLQALFEAIDSSGDGSLSSDELSGFRDKMMAALKSESGSSGTPGAQGGHHVHGPAGPGGAGGPPPPPPPPASDNDADDSSTAALGGSHSTGSSASATGTTQAPGPDMRVFLQKLAETYARFAAQSDSAFGSSASASGSVSTSA